MTNTQENSALTAEWFVQWMTQGLETWFKGGTTFRHCFPSVVTSTEELFVGESWGSEGVAEWIQESIFDHLNPEEQGEFRKGVALAITTLETTSANVPVLLVLIELAGWTEARECFSTWGTLIESNMFDLSIADGAGISLFSTALSWTISLLRSEDGVEPLLLLARTKWFGKGRDEGVLLLALLEVDSKNFSAYMDEWGEGFLIQLDSRNKYGDRQKTVRRWTQMLVNRVGKKELAQILMGRSASWNWLREGLRHHRVKT